MKRQSFSLRRRQLMAISTLGAGAVAAPAVVMAAHQPAMQREQRDGDRMVVSGRIVDETDGRALAGAQIEIWQADARGVRAEHTHAVITADGDGRYFAAVNGRVQRLHYRASHQGHTTKVTQLHAIGTTQRSVTLTHDDAGTTRTTRAAFEMSLAPRHTLASGMPEYIAL